MERAAAYQRADLVASRRRHWHIIHLFGSMTRVGMWGTDEASSAVFGYVDLEEWIPAHHPLRKIRLVVNDALSRLDADFNAVWAVFGRHSITSERLIRASLIQFLSSIRSARQLMEKMQVNLLFLGFVGPGIDDAALVPVVFRKNRDPRNGACRAAVRDRNDTSPFARLEPAADARRRQRL